MKIVDLDSLRLDVDSFLKSNSSINAVVITNTYVTDNNGIPEVKNGIWVIHNSFQKNRLPSSLRLPNEINSDKGSLISDKYIDL